jgi:hypothetical protein
VVNIKVRKRNHKEGNPSSRKRGQMATQPNAESRNHNPIHTLLPTVAFLNSQSRTYRNHARLQLIAKLKMSPVLNYTTTSHIRNGTTAKDVSSDNLTTRIRKMENMGKMRKFHVQRMLPIH